METRLPSSSSLLAKKSALPADYLKMVTEIFTTNFDEGLKALSATKKGATLETHGAIYAEEILLTLTLSFTGEIAATTVLASVDFDPKASAPTAPDLLAACVDAIGTVCETLLSPKNTEGLRGLTEQSLSAFEKIPFEWAPIEVERHTIYVRVDKSNPKLDDAADEWLKKHDPLAHEIEQRTQAETEALFITGPSKKPGGGESIH